MVILTLFRCHYAGNERNCNDLFEVAITDEGHCCSFNLMPEYLLYKDEVQVTLLFFCTLLSNRHLQIWAGMERDKYVEVYWILITEM